MTRVQWTSDETTQVIHAYHKMVLNSTLPSRGEDAWRKAQHVLPSVRHRPFTHSPSAVELNKIYRSMLSNGKFTKQMVPVIQVQPPPPDKNIVHIDGFGPMRQEVYDNVVAHFVRLNPNPRPSLDEVFSRLIDERIQSAIPKIFDGVDVRLLDHQAKMLTMMNTGHATLMRYLDPAWVDPAATPEIIDAPKPRETKNHRPLIILVNANAAQQQTLQKEFPQFEIKISEGRVPAELSPLLVVGFTKFMDGTLDKACGKKFEDSYLKISSNGAASEARFKIRNRLVNVSFDGN